ncbi:hypothetical protein VE02_02154 [Pseudogymnoascus sp. 03VT05]|nr:hypothetical protein VE02_02154 [Pseudogymnoascus sp. 03VT05]
MRYSFAAAALAAATLTTSVNGFAMPQASSSGCQPSFEGSFQIKVVSGSTPATPRMKKRAQCGSSGSLVATLKDGILNDAQGRIGSIVSNHQFQFDPAPGQVNAITTSGFSVCNNKLGLRGSTNFFQCRSGDFFNLYDQSIAPQCEPITIDIISCASGGDPPGDPPVSQVGDGQPQSGAGQQLGDGQVQNPAGAQQGGAAGEAGEGQIQSPAGAQQEGAAGEAGEGQIQSPGAQQGGSAGQQGGQQGGSSSGGLEHLAVEPQALNRVGAEEEPVPAVVELVVGHQLALRAQEAHSLAAEAQEEEAVPLVDSPLETTQEEEAAREEALLNKSAMVSSRAGGEEEAALPKKPARVKFRVPLDSKGFDKVISVR